MQTFKIGAYNEKLCKENPVANIHPTVKPIELMRWLVRLLTPKGGFVLDPFAHAGPRPPRRVPPHQQGHKATTAGSRAWCSARA